MKKKVVMRMGLACVLSLCFLTPVFALEESLGDLSSIQTSQPLLTASASQPDSLESLEGVNIDMPTQLPTTFGLWWRGIKERVKIVTTFDPVKKDELRLKYAEERMKLAELIAQKSDKQEVQAKAQKMVERSQDLMSRVEEHKDKFLQNPDERVQRLMKNIGIHQISREQVMDTLEEKFEGKLTDEQMNKLRELREKGLKDGQRFLNAINNEKIPEQVREHLQQVQNRVEEHTQGVKQFQEQKKELLDAAKNGDEQAKEKLDQLWQERKQKMEEVRSDFKEKADSNTSTRKIIQKIEERKTQPETRALEKVRELRDTVKQRVETTQNAVDTQ
ncbi:MAG: hypothetical protein WCW16_01955 [Candidatus Magasanikbacteria bacterium]